MSTTKRALEATPSATELPKRKGSKPGRKPLDTEAKNKRTAQNRAAQRAFRERKERKMQELEEKVQQLEKIREQSEMESEFLRSQLMTLIAELKRYRPEQSTDSQVLSYLAKREEEHKTESTTGGSISSVGAASSDPETSVSDTRSSSADTHVQENIDRKRNFTFEFPWKTQQVQSFAQLASPAGSSAASATSLNHKPSLASNTPSTSSGSVDMFYTSDNQSLPKFVTEPISNDFDFNSPFDEQVSEFCSKMNEVCGTKECPVPPALPSEKQLTNTWDSPQFGQVGFGSEVDDTNKWLLAGAQNNSANPGSIPAPSTADSLPFIDASVAFPSDRETDIFRNTSDDVLGQFFEDDPIVSQLTTEESNYDQFKTPHEASRSEKSTGSIDSTGSALSAASVPTISTTSTEPNYTTGKADYADAAAAVFGEIVPSRDGKLLKCSEVWDRITAHPKYSDLDIDGLCMELRTKAKCSEKGVVVNVDDVQQALTKHMS